VSFEAKFERLAEVLGVENPLKHLAKVFEKAVDISLEKKDPKKKLERRLERERKQSARSEKSCDGSRLAYYSRVDDLTHILDPNKPWTEQTPLALPPLSDGQDHFRIHLWSQDDRWLAGRVVNASAQIVGAAVYSLESQQYHRLTDYYGIHWAWQPDSRRLLCLGVSGEIFLVDIETREVREVLSLAPDRLNWARLSHDGQWMYFTRTTEEADIWMLTLNEEQK
jgi:hypothetical protein